MASTQIRQTIIRSARLVVVKIGTNVLADADGRLNVRRVRHLADQIGQLHRSGRRVVVVSSGAIGAGIGQLNLDGRPTSLPLLQAAAAVGQVYLVQHFNHGLGKHDLHAAQILVTRKDFDHRVRYLNIRNTINALQRLNAVPVINENDTVAVDELRFGDNDMIAAMVSNLVRADLLVVLSTVDGLLANGRRVDLVERIDADVRRHVTDTNSTLGSGGMASKLKAISLATGAGEHAMIANGLTRNVLLRIFEGEQLGTVFAASDRKLSSRRRWIGLTVRPSGTIQVDEGASKAIREQGRSLLAVGVTGVKGGFSQGDVVQIVDVNGRTLARGLVNYDARQVEQIKGLRSDQIDKALGQKPYDEIIHRDNLVRQDNL